MLGPPSSAGRVKCQAHLWSYTLAPTGLREAADGLEGTVLVGLQSWGCVLWDMVPAAEPLVSVSTRPAYPTEKETLGRENWEWRHTCQVEQVNT